MKHQPVICVKEHFKLKVPAPLSREDHQQKFWLVDLEFYSPVNTTEVTSSWSVYLTTLLTTEASLPTEKFFPCQIPSGQIRLP